MPRRTMANGTWATSPGATRPTGASTSGTASPAPPTKASSHRRSASIPRWPTSRTSCRAGRASLPRTSSSTTWTPAAASTPNSWTAPSASCASTPRRAAHFFSTCRWCICISPPCRTPTSRGAPAPGISPILWWKWTTASGRYPAPWTNWACATTRSSFSAATTAPSSANPTAAPLAPGAAPTTPPWKAACASPSSSGGPAG
ncbi:hypothetical protein D9M68_742470 [compost metagenome]